MEEMEDSGNPDIHSGLFPIKMSSLTVLAI